MKDTKLCFYDFETGSKNANKTQPVQLSAIMIDPIKLEIIPDSIFDSYINVTEDEKECERLGIETVQQEALDVNHVTWEQIRAAPPLKEVWESYTSYVAGYAKTKSQWDQPIRCGFNIINFDNKIIDRLCQLMGPWDKVWNTQKLHHPIHMIDVMQDVYRWTEGQNFKSISMDAVRTWLGINPEFAHNSKKDILDGAFLMIKFLKLYRYFYGNVIWKNSFEKENEIIRELMG